MNQNTLLNSCSSSLIHIPKSDGLKIQDSVIVTKKRLSKLSSIIPTQSTEGRELCKDDSPVNNITDDEKWILESLPTNWIPNKEESEIVSKLQDRLREKHDGAVRNMFKELCKIHDLTEAAIRIRSRELKEEMEIQNMKTQEFLNKLNVPEICPTSLDRNIFRNGFRELQERTKFKRQNIDLYYEQLHTLEKERNDLIKRLLRANYQILFKIGYLLPFELHRFLEGEILKLNQTKLANFRIYENIYFKLICRNSTEYKQGLTAITLAKREWRERKHKFIKDNIRGMTENLSIDMENQFLSSKEGNRIAEVFEQTESQLADIISRFFFKDNKCPVATDLHQWNRDMQTTIDGLDKNAREMICHYKFQIAKRFQSLYSDVVETSNKLMGNDDEQVSTRSHDETQDYCKTMVESTKEPYDYDVKALENLWEKVMEDMQVKLKSTYTLVFHSAEIWERHAERVSKAQSIITELLSKVFRNHDIHLQEMEKKFNIVLDQLREASTEQELEYHHQGIKTKLDQNKQMLQEQVQIEMELAKKYENLIRTENDVLKAELTHFLQTYPKSSLNIPTPQTFYQNFYKQVQIPCQMKRCLVQIQSIANWKFGLWDAMERYKDNTLNDCNLHISSWIQEKTEQIEKRNELKLYLQQERFERIRCGPYNDRLMEIRAHAERFVEHDRAIVQIFAAFDEKLRNSKASDRKIAVEFDHTLVQIKKQIQQKNTVKELRFVMKKLRGIKDEAHTIVSTAAHFVFQELKESILTVKTSNMRFIQSLRLFSEGGNYSRIEMNTYKDKLVKLENRIDRNRNRIRKEIRRNEMRVLEKLTHRMEGVQDFYSNFLFDIKFFEHIVNLVTQLHADIKSSVYNLKFELTKIKTGIADLNEFLENIQVWTNLELVEPKVQKLLSQMRDLENVLRQPDKMFDLEPLDLPKSNLKPSNTKKSSASVVKIKRKIYSKKMQYKPKKQSREIHLFAPVDYREVLFPWMPRPSIHFIENICFRILQVYTEIQGMAMRFYTKKVKQQIFRKDLIQPDYDTFLEEILSKLKYYHIQCEEAWMNVVQEFTSQIKIFKDTFVKYSSNYVKTYGNSKITEISTMSSEYLTLMEATQTSNQEEWGKLYNRLKPMYGYKKNNHLLDSLTEEVHQFLSTRAKSNEELKNCKTRIQKRFKSFRKSITAIYEILLENINLICDETVTKSLIEQFYKRLNSRKKNRVPEEHRVSLDTKSLRLPSLVTSSSFDAVKIDQMMKRLKKRRDPVQMKEDKSYGFEIEPVCGEIQLGLAELTDTFVQNYGSKAADIIDKCDTFRGMNEKQSEEWLKQYNFDVQKILKLYTVKYE